MTMPTTLMRAHDEPMGDGAPELPDKPQRRSFTAEYKLRIVAEYDACVGDGDKGALLRREGLYSSHIVEWRRARENAAAASLAAPRRAKTSSDAAALAKAQKKIERLEDDLKKQAFPARFGCQRRSNSLVRTPDAGVIPYLHAGVIP
jgi:transposase